MQDPTKLSKTVYREPPTNQHPFGVDARGADVLARVVYGIRTSEKVAFNPWNCLPEHQPLGSLNRMRLAVYTASARARHRLNGV